MEVIDMDDEMEPVPCKIDVSASYTLKINKSISPDKRLRLAPKIEKSPATDTNNHILMLDKVS